MIMQSSLNSAWANSDGLSSIPICFFCARCRGELAEFEKNRTFLADVKDAYAKTEADYFEMRSKRERR